MAKEQILVIEDELDILELIRFNLSREGYRVIAQPSGETGLRAAKTSLPDLVVLDLMLPEIDGLEVCKILKSDPKTAHVPIIMLTAKGEEADIVTGLEVGADDYIVKPFSPKVLIARVRAILRRKSKAQTADQAALKIGDLTIHPGRHEVLVDGQPTTLTLTEFQILHLLARKPGWVFTRDHILNEIRGEDVYITDRSIDVQIVGLRKKLGVAGKAIETVRGVGYKFKE